MQLLSLAALPRPLPLQAAHPSPPLPLPSSPTGPVSPSELANIFNTAAQRSSGLTLKQFLTALAMISPDLTTLTNHMVAQLGPQMKPRAGGDAPQPATFPLRNLDLKSQAAQAHWGAAQNVMSAANAFMRAGAAHAANGGGHDGGAVQQRISGGPTAGGGFAGEWGGRYGGAAWAGRGGRRVGRVECRKSC